MADDIGGIQAEISANAAPFLAELQKAEAAAKDFNAKYGNLKVVIAAELRMPSQTAIRDYTAKLQKAIDLAAPQQVSPIPGQVAPTGPVARGAVQQPGISTPVGQGPVVTMPDGSKVSVQEALRRMQGQAVIPAGPDPKHQSAVIAVPVQTPIQRPPIQQPAAAQSSGTPLNIPGLPYLGGTERQQRGVEAQERIAGMEDSEKEAAAQKRANETGANKQWTDADQRIHTVKPTTRTRGQVSPESKGPTISGEPIVTPGPEFFTGRGAGTGAGVDFDPLLAEQAAIGRRAIAAGFFGQGPTQVGQGGGGGAEETAGLTPAQAAQRRAASPFLVPQRAQLAGRLGGLTRSRGPNDPETVAAREALAAYVPPVPETRRAEVKAILTPPPQPEATQTDVGQAAAAELAEAHSAEAQMHALAETLGTSVANIERMYATPEAVEAAVAKFRSDNPEFEEIYNEALESIERQAGQAASRSRLPTTGPTIAERRAVVASESDVGQLLRTTAELRKQAQTSLIQVQAQTQTRALPTFLASQIATATGRPEAVELQRESTAILAKQAALQEALVVGETKRAQTLGVIHDLQAAIRKESPDSEAYAELTEELDGQVESFAKLSDSVDRTKGSLVQVNEEVKELDERSRSAATGGMRQVAASFVGGIAGSLVFAVGMQAVTAGIEAFTKASAYGIGTLTDWRDVANEQAEVLSKQTIALHGLVEESVSARLAQSAISASVGAAIRPLLEERASIQSGSEALKDQIDLIHTWSNLRNQQISGGAIPGISTGIGGVAGTQIFAEPGIIEQLSRLTPSGQKIERGIGGAAIGGVVGGVIGGGIGLLGGGVGVVPGAAIGASLGTAAGTLIGGFGGPSRPGPAPTGPGTATGPGGGAFTFPGQDKAYNAWKANADRWEVQVSAMSLAVDDLNEAMERGTDGAEAFGHAVTGLSPDDAAVQRTSLLLQGLQVPQDQIDNLRDAGFALQGIADIPDLEAGIDAAKEFYEAAARGFTQPAAEAVLSRLTNQVIPARLFQLTQTARIQREFIGTQAGVARAAQPFLPLGTTVPPPGPAGSGIPGGLAAVSPALQPFLEQSRKYDQLSVQRIQAARVEIANLALPGERAGALASFDRLRGLGQDRANIQTFVTQQQTNLITAQYNEQLRQARLQLADLAVLSGRVASSGGDNLGVLEKQNIQLQRANSLLQIQLSGLQLELQQRQINFQVAIAGFTAPGVTGAERAARIEQAELEASFAQQQLDLQKEILANQAQSVPLQIAIQDIQFNRDYISALNAIDLLTQGRQVNIDTAAAQESIQRIDVQIEEETAKLQTFIQAGQAAVTAFIADQAKYIEEYSNATTDLQESAVQFFDEVSDAYAGGLIKFLTRVSNYAQNYGSNLDTQARQREGGAYAQTGFYGSVQNRTTITVGEAGAETVAILRNPRDMEWGGGGSGMQVNLSIMVTGNTLRSEQDIEMMTSDIVRKVEESLSRRTSLLGFRTS